MLKHLQIENYALIERLDISISNGFSVITGETGAGKSILLGALGLVIGKRADTQMLRVPSAKCFVEAGFDISEYGLEQFFKDNDLDFENETTIRREILPNGKSRAFVNDTPVSINQLKDIGSVLIDIHSQHETLLLNTTDFQFSLIDAYSGHLDKVELYKTEYKTLKKLKGRLENLLESQRKSQLDKDYFQFQLDELFEMNLVPGEQQDLESELKTLNNAEEIKSRFYQATNAISENEGSVAEQLRDIAYQINQLRDYDKVFADIANRVQSALIEIEDISGDMDRIQNNISHDPERIEIVSNRLDKIYSLQQKHHVNCIDDLLKIQFDLEEKLSNISSLENELEEAKKGLKIQNDIVGKLAEELSNGRKKHGPVLKKEVEALLAVLGMPNSLINIELTDGDKTGPLGKDEINLMFSANKGSRLSDLTKVASGGELSRLMLSIKSIICRYTALPTIIFDEIDTGVSGEVADKVGNIMKQMGDIMQVISITHLPQIAGKGKNHFYVHKDEINGVTHTKIKQLSTDERVEEIAKMLSGEKLTRAAMENARELLNQ